MNRNRRATRLAVAAALAFACGKGGGGPQSDWDVRGNYDLTYDNTLKLQLAIGGAVRQTTVSGYGSVADFGTWAGQPLKLDLNQYCGKPEVVCPSEAYWSKVAIDQKDVTKDYDLHVLYVVNDTTHNLPAGEKAESRGGLVNHRDSERFVVGLGAAAGASGNCGALALSLAGGRFTHENEKSELVTVYRDPTGASCNPDAGAPDAGFADGGGPPPCNPVQITKYSWPDGGRVNGIKEGKVGLGWAGACAWGPVVAGAILTMETGYSGVRTGDFNPPPYTPSDPVPIDGGFELDAGSAGDGGRAD